MHISAHAQALLKLVFAATSGALTRPRLERLSGLLRPELNQALAELVRFGLLDAQRLRLTMPGLALAVAAASGARGSPGARVLRTRRAVFRARSTARRRLGDDV